MAIESIHIYLSLLFFPCAMHFEVETACKSSYVACIVIPIVLNGLYRPITVVCTRLQVSTFKVYTELVLGDFRVFLFR